MALFALSFLYLPLIHLSLQRSLFSSSKGNAGTGTRLPSYDQFSTPLTKIDELPVRAKQARGKREQIRGG